MKFLTMSLLMGAIASAWTPALVSARDEQSNARGVFVMTNNAGRNEVIAYDRDADGTLHDPHHYATDGRGSGGNVDPLASQGSLTLSKNGSWLFAVNAGSGTVSAFRVQGSHLWLSDRISTEGSEPNSVTQHGNLVYVLNTAGSSGVVGFYFDDGKFVRIPDSIRFLSANAVGSGVVTFSPDGHFLLVTEKVTNTIDIFRVSSDGMLAPITVNTDVGPGTFSGTFAPSGIAIVAETGPPGPKGAAIPDASAISSYALQANGTLKVISASIPTLGTANCWDVVTSDGRYVYTSNSASASIAGFSIGRSGALTPIGSTIVATLPSGATNLDIAASADGKFLYTLNAGNGTIGEFAIDNRTGQLTALGAVRGLPPASGFNGIAAN
ncbi:MAG TPA: beta-propeller fold lactonase family protein [Rhizomicrobium sp.]|jgi:6-phosphogluconolactonase (cycloisomerase 2 family)|nr:beta-propeller fold lactonase family protein [Rhizomicrobium sp.]